MGWSGNVFSRVHNWVTDAAASVNITASRMDAEDDNLAAGIEACLRKSGENEPSADLPMATQKHTNVGNGSARNHYAAIGQVQDSSFSYSADTGSANTYVMTLSPAITAYATGGRYVFIAGNNNSGASTLNINGVGATAIRKNGTTALASGDIVAGQVIECVYDGTYFQMKTDAAALAAALVAANNLSDLTNAGTARSNLGVDAAGTDNSTNVTLAGTPDYITLSGQQITRNPIVLTTDVSGTLPVGNGGTGQTSEAAFSRRVTLNWTIQSDPGGTPSGTAGDVFAYY